MMKKSEEIIGLAKSSFVALKSLQSDYLENLHSEFHPFETNIGLEQDDRSERIIESLEKVELGINQAELIVNLMEYFDMVEANQMRLNAMIMRLSEENSWLREEITATQTRLGSVEEQNIDLENQIKDYELKLELKKYDHPLSNSYSNSQLSDSVNLSESTLSGPLSETINNDLIYYTKKSSNKNSKTSKTETDITNNYNYELPDHLKTLHSLVINYSSQGRYEVAMALCKQAIQNEINNISIKKQIFTEDSHTPPNEFDICSLDVAALQNIFALVYRDQGNYVDAVELLNKSLSIREKLLGVNHPLVAITLNNIAILQAKNGKLREAENMCRRALTIREQHLGSNHPDVAKQLFNLALLCQNQGRYEEVEQIYKKALSIYADNYGPDNINVIKTRNNIAYVHLKQNNFVQAEIIFKELLTCWHERFTYSPSDKSSLLYPKKPLWVLVEDKTLFGSGTILKNSTELQKILPLYSLAADIPKDEFDLFSSTISYLMRAYKAQGKLIEADLLEEWLSRSIKQFENNKCKFSSNERYNGWSTSLTNSIHSEECFSFQPFSPDIRNNKGNQVIDTSSESSSRYSLRRISSKISSKFKSIRSQVTASPDDNDLLNSTKNSNSQNINQRN